MKLSPERRISRALRSALEPIADMKDLPESAELQDVLIGLEHFLPSLLAELYPYWKGESLDGLFLSHARKTGAGKVELQGVCILISDQTITPFHLRMEVSRTADQILLMECRLGKRGDGKGEMERIPYSRWNGHLFAYLQDSLQPVEWTYKVGFGAEC